MPSDEDEMLRTMGLRSIEDLFADIPAAVRIPKLDLPDGLPEDLVVARVTSMLAANRTVVDMPTFLGGGLYDHFVPASVRAVTGRSEFYTSYTPYQPEISQGLLQALWEYQSLVCELTGMDAANTSMYDGSTALGEAARMASRLRPGRTFLVPRALRHNRRAVLANYVLGTGIVVREVDFDRTTGMLDLGKLREALSPDVCGVYVENPNFFGRFEEQLDEIRSSTDAIFVVGVNPIAQAVVRPPGDFDADIVIGEGQPLGTQMNFGGPLLGLFACRQEHIRKMPGRVIGLTGDASGHRAFCMTLQTREQHIRREKAMSNICTNESLLAVAAAAYLSILGANGLRRVAAENIRRARDLATAIDKIPGFTAPIFRGPHFNEFVVRREGGYAAVHRHLLEKGLHGGMPLTRQLPELSDAALFATTGRHTPEALALLLKALEAIP
jgi:glycine dehydrogenase subunit 1